MASMLPALLGAIPACESKAKAPPTAVRYTPPAIMGTQCAMTAVVDPNSDVSAKDALLKAEKALRAIEFRMSTYIQLTELSRLNAAEAGQTVKLSAGTLEVLRLAKRLHEQTDKAFDATCLPLFLLWGRAGKAKHLPTEAELAAARGACGWDKFELLASGARKTDANAGLGLGGIAKGYAIDRASETLRKAGCTGGLVDVGGDIHCFGRSPSRGRWRVAIRNPFGAQQFFGTLELTDRAVCTSGNYERFTEIEGKRYSHIVDPRTGRPVDFAPSVTVVAPTAAVADGWATALSVLGKKGLELLDADSGIEAMIVQGGPDDYEIHQTPGFAKLLLKPPPTSARAPAE